MLPGEKICPVVRPSGEIMQYYQRLLAFPDGGTNSRMSVYRLRIRW